MIPDRKPDYFFTVPGNCIPKQRPRGAVVKGKLRFYMDPIYVAYVSKASKAFRVMAPKVPTDKKVALMIDLRFDNKRRRDADNCAGSIMDALSKLLYDDDHQVETLFVTKKYKQMQTDPYTGKMVAKPAKADVSIWILEEA